MRLFLALLALTLVLTYLLGTFISNIADNTRLVCVDDNAPSVCVRGK